MERLASLTLIALLRYIPFLPSCVYSHAPPLLERFCPLWCYRGPSPMGGDFARGISGARLFQHTLHVVSKYTQTFNFTGLIRKWEAHSPLVYSLDSPISLYITN